MKLYQFEGVDDLLENPDGVVPIRRAIIKPLITCQECRKWHTMYCPHKQIAIRNSIIVNPGYEVHWTDADDYCKDGTPKEPK